MVDASCAPSLRVASTSAGPTPARKRRRPIFTALPNFPALLQTRDRAGLAGEFENVEPRIGAIDHVDIAAIVGLHIVALDRDLAAVLAVDFDAALFRSLSNRRDEIAHLLGTIGVAQVNSPHAGIEPSDERELLIEYRRHAFVARVRAEAAAATAEISAALGHVEIRYDHRFRLDRCIDEP